ncbi:MAG: tetratricopeptide repeat protein [Candidatus Rhabdochlamydia sp.]
MHEKALEIALELKDRVGEGTVYTNLGLDYYSLKEYLKAIEFHNKHLLIALELSDRIGECNAYGNLGAAYLSLKDYPQAFNCQTKSLNIALELKDSAKEGMIHLSLGSTYASLGNIHQAASCYHRALTIALNLNNTVEVGKAYINLGTVYDSLGAYDKAIEFHEKALAIALELKDVLGEWRAYCNLGRMDYLLGNYAQAEEYFRKGIHITSPLQQDVKRAQWQVTLFEEWSNLYLILEETLLRQNKTLDALEITDMRRARALSSLIRDKLSSQKREAPFLEQVSFTTMQKLSKKFNTAFITYSFIYPQEGPYIKVWIISPHQNSREPISLSLSFDSNTFKNISTLLKTFPYGLRPRVKRGEKATDAFKKHLSHWYELLITPLEPYLSQVKENQSLTFIPDKFLAHLPFGAFYHAATDQYLIEKYPISLAPSIKVLHLLDELSPSLSQGILLMGNPLTPHAQDNHLKFTEVEVREILAPLMNVPLNQVLTQENATTENFLKQAPQARIIHIACHGMIEENAQDHPDSNFDPHSVFKGLFKLTPDEAHPSGIFRSEEIASMSLKADLVFMSACHLGRGNLKREGSIGPIWSFLGSGAKSTIASYWPLPDSAVTVQMVEVFYRYLLGIGAPKLNKAEALQKAILLGMQKNRDNIEQWGSFFLSGLIA